MINTSQKKTNPSARIFNPITIFMVGDVMTGRGIDQLLPHPGDSQYP
jgi:poly-gamma-glutamate synthesis protein (capsule biosynthesis protein)